MARSTLLVLVAAFALVGGAVLVAQSDALGPSHAPSERTRVDAPGTTEVIVPYRCNRALVFHSMIAHSTDRYRFKEGYENRRINITLLYGHAA